jgi:hypothetical protein
MQRGLFFLSEFSIFYRTKLSGLRWRERLVSVCYLIIEPLIMDLCIGGMGVAAWHRPAQPEKWTPAYVIHPPGLHPMAIRGDDPR